VGKHLVYRLKDEGRAPKLLFCDNGSEFSSQAMDLWAYQNGAKIDFSRPGKLTDNAFIESFNGTFRDECLNVHGFESLTEAKQLIEAWRQEYNESRPHRVLKWPRFDRLGTLIRHAAPEPAATIGARAVAMIQPPLDALLMTPVGGATLPAPRMTAAQRAAITLAVIAARANPEHHPAIGVAAKPKPQNNFSINRHPCA